MQALSKEFTSENPHIEIRWVLLDENTLRRRLLSDLAISNGQFDIITIGPYETSIWSKNEWLFPITPLQINMN